MPIARHARTVLLVVAAGATALWVLPARWAMAWIPDASPIVITNASGSLWSAQASLAVGAPGLRRTLPDPVQWQLVFNGRPTLQIRHPWLGGPVDVGLSWRGVWVSAQSLQLPATVLTTAHALFNTLDPGGEVYIQWSRLALGWGTIQAGDDPRLVLVQWRNASSSLSRVRPMGQYSLSVALAADQRLTLALDTEQGPLFLQGSGEVPASGRMQFDGRAWVDPSASADKRLALRSLLDILGPPTTPNGDRPLRLR
ncbi:type II secretion system protein N [Alcaligenaceae bacterium CGII-47]|nr:type II secretion system protein N [Alcaligenaceae bacterium CGII-47]